MPTFQLNASDIKDRVVSMTEPGDLSAYRTTYRRKWPGPPGQSPQTEWLSHRLHLQCFPTPKGNGSQKPQEEESRPSLMIPCSCGQVYIGEIMLTALLLRMILVNICCSVVLFAGFCMGLILLACSCVVAVGALLIALFGDVHLSHQ